MPPTVILYLQADGRLRVCCINRPGSVDSRAFTENSIVCILNQFKIINSSLTSKDPVKGSLFHLLKREIAFAHLKLVDVGLACTAYCLPSENEKLCV